ncbi:hypothetical protein D3C71_1458560 [compost metagenome]
MDKLSVFIMGKRLNSCELDLRHGGFGLAHCHRCALRFDIAEPRPRDNPSKRRSLYENGSHDDRECHDQNEVASRKILRQAESKRQRDDAAHACPTQRCYPSCSEGCGASEFQAMK